MEANQMFTVGLVPSQQLVSLLTDDEGNWRDAPEGQAVVPLVKIPKPEGAWEPNVVWFEDRVERQWIAGTPAPAPTFTAEDWITGQGYTATRLVSLLDVEAKLNAAAKVSPKASAVRGWLDTVLGAFAADPAPKNTWPVAPHGYEETIQEAVFVLSA